LWNKLFSDKEDCELAARCQKGDSLAFEALVRKHRQEVLKLAFYYLRHRDYAEDVVQKIFTKVYLSLPMFDIHRPFFPWLYRIAIHKCYDELRSMRCRKVFTFSELSLDETEKIEKLISRNEVSPVSDDNRREMHALLHRVLDQLPDPHRMAMVLRHIEALPYAKIAETMMCTEQAARLRVFRARALFKTLIEKALKK
jgi:RNA polymerase sigma-70 factor, ECF subfamily